MSYQSDRKIITWEMFFYICNKRRTDEKCSINSEVKCDCPNKDNMLECPMWRTYKNFYYNKDRRKYNGRYYNKKKESFEERNQGNKWRGNFVKKEFQEEEA